MPGTRLVLGPAEGRTRVPGMTAEWSMRAFARSDPAHTSALDRVREWTRARFALADETAILVAEVACAIPGCPPLETVIAFWADGKRHHFKIFKPVADIAEDDLPPSWMKDSLAVPEDFECDCC
jgi:nitrate reductase delta subunit